MPRSEPETPEHEAAIAVLELSSQAVSQNDSPVPQGASFPFIAERTFTNKNMSEICTQEKVRPSCHFEEYQRSDLRCSQLSLLLVNYNKSLDRCLNRLTLRTTPPHPVFAANKSNSPRPCDFRPSLYSQLHNTCNKEQQLEFITLSPAARYSGYTTTCVQDSKRYVTTQQE